jgi:uncharacterized protein (TIGR03083 family)
VPTDVTELTVWLDALAGSHDRLSDLVGELDDEGLRRKSYCDEWTIAQVLSHLGSGAEILDQTVEAVIKGEEPPSRETYPHIWARWNALAPQEVTEAALSADGELVDKLEHLGDSLDDLEFTLFGVMRTDAVGLLRARLSEHSLHTWDVAVALDPVAVVDEDAVTLLIDRLPEAAAWLGKPDRVDDARPFTMRVVTSDPDGGFDVEVADAVTITPIGGTRTATATNEVAGPEPTLVHLPAEAFLRLVYGRLDPSHAPRVDAKERAAIESLRKVFPGV